MLRVGLLALVFSCGLAAQVPAGAAGKRFALVIANSAYSKGLPPIPAAAQEARLMESSLKKAGFDVTVVENIRLPEFPARLLPEFLAKLKAGDDCVIHYSGHAVQVSGINYLLPVDFDPKDRSPIESRGYALDNLPEELNKKRAGLKLLVLEASRAIDLPSGASAEGLAIPEMSDYREIVFVSSTQPNSVVKKPYSEGVGLFTKALAEAIAKRGPDLLGVLSEAQRGAMVGSQMAQQPFYLPKLTQQFYFLEPEKIAPVVITKTAGPSVGTFRSNRRDRQEYVWVPSGTFKMGCVPSDKRCENHEKPQHEVTISKPFWIGRNEVTVDAYRRFVDADKSRRMPRGPIGDGKWEKHTGHPIHSVKWSEANEYCGWIGGRLPTEAEWEYAARAGVADEVVPLNDENSRDKANFAGQSGNDRYDQDTAPVRSFDANPWGLYDMFGNLWEWVADWYSPTYYASSPKTDPQGPETGKERVARGGSWYSDARQHLRISYRQAYGKEGNIVGFRCVMDDTPETRKILDIQP
jgi:formylglycine-generating enzyme required for sulfatase activity